MHSILILFVLFMAISCGKNAQETADQAIDVALSYLSDEKCDDALEVLREAGMQSDNAVYLQVLASAYACKADFNEISFIETDLSAIDVTDPKTIVKSLAIMTTSPETAADSVGVTSITSALNTLYKSTSGTPSHAARVAKFGSRKAGDLSVQALILGLVNMGKFLRYYGNTNSTGVKGSGGGTNSCFLNYTDVRAGAIILAGSTGACTPASNGHPDLDITTATGIRRACVPIVDLNNAIDILESIDLTNSSTLSKLEQVASKIIIFKTTATSMGLTSVIGLRSYSDCEAFGAVGSQALDLQYYFALTFEESLQ